jgi:hypothetical protein
VVTPTSADFNTATFTFPVGAGEYDVEISIDGGASYYNSNLLFSWGDTPQPSRWLGMPILPSPVALMLTGLTQQTPTVLLMVQLLKLVVLLLGPQTTLLDTTLVSF